MKEVRRHRVGTATILLAVVVAVGASVGPAAARSSGENERVYAGLSLDEALHRLERTGLRILFSSDLVRPDMKVAEEPRGQWPREILDELLAPHGLSATPGPRGSVLVVAGPPRGALRGLVRDARSHEPLPEARIVAVGSGVSVPTGSDGRFRTPWIPVGIYAVEVTCAGHVAARLEAVTVAAGRTTEVRVKLAPLEAPSEEVVVRVPGAGGGIAPAAATLSGSDLDQSPELSFDPLRTAGRLPGVVSDDGRAPIHLRGGADDEVLIALDGLELHSPFHLKDRAGLFSIVDSRALGELRLLSGAFPAEYGGRMSGVLELTSSAPPDAADTGIDLSSDGGRAVTAGGYADGRGHWLLTARHGRADDVLEALGADSGYRPRYFDVFGKTSFRVGERSVLGLNLLTAQDEVEGPHGAPLETTDEPGALRSNDVQQYGWLHLTTDLSDRLAFRTTLSGIHLHQTRGGRTASVSGVLDERWSSIVGLSQAWSLVRGRQGLRWGFDLQDLEARYRYDPGAPPGCSPSCPAVIGVHPGGTDMGLYLSDAVRISPSLEVEVGFRWDRQSYVVGGDSQVSPRMNLAYRLGSGTFRVGWGYAHQPQRIDELPIADGVTDFDPAQRAEHRSLEYDRPLPGGVELRVAAYEKLMTELHPRHENLFDPYGLFPEASPDRVTIDAERALARGLELSATGPAGARLGWSAAYTLARSEDRIDGRDVPRSWDERHALDAAIHYRPGRGWSMSLAGGLHSGWPTTPVRVREGTLADGTTGTTLVPGPRNSDRLPSYWRLDARVARAFRLGRARMEAFANVTNLLDRENLVGFDLRSRRPALEDRHGIPRLFTFGLGARF